MVGIKNHSDCLDFSISLEDLLYLLLCWIVWQILNKNCLAAKWWFLLRLFNWFLSGSQLNLQISGSHRNTVFCYGPLGFRLGWKSYMAIASAPPTILIAWQLNESKSTKLLLYFSTVLKQIPYLVFISFIWYATDKHIRVGLLCFLLLHFLWFFLSFFHFLTCFDFLYLFLPLDDCRLLLFRLLFLKLLRHSTMNNVC